jgi:hypothetical protein
MSSIQQHVGRSAVTETQKKRHHYIPIAYLSKFSDKDGRVYAYRKDDPVTPLHVNPSEIAFERYYYSQPLPDGGRDNNKIENFLSTIETTWPAIVDHIRKRDVTPDDFVELCVFMGFMRVRVPATRDFVELALAEQIKALARLLDEKGQLPPKPEAHPDILENLQVSIDPHQSLHAMAPLLQGFSRVMDSLEYHVLHNETDVSFLSSDNPVVYFDPSVPEDRLLPYRVEPPHGPIELLFPIDAKTVVLGRTGRPRMLSHYTLSSTRPVKRINRLVSRFGYRFVFASDKTHGAIISKYATTSPIGQFTTLPTANGYLVSAGWGFGPRPQKPKWTGAKEPNDE